VNSSSVHPIEIAGSPSNPDGDFVAIALQRAATTPQQVGFTFLVDGETEELHLTYGELDQRARSLAAELRELELPGRPVLLALPPGLDFVVALMGCLYAGAIAAPCYPPGRARNARGLDRLRAIAQKADVGAALVAPELLAETPRWIDAAPELKPVRWLSVRPGAPRADAWVRPAIEPRAAAVLQYTSGSTAQPRGVILTHRNLTHNAKVIHDFFGVNASTRGLSWLPPYHDMGLIGGILEPLYAGIPVTLMSPIHFVQRPLRWLEAISRTRASASGGPNFAFELCLRNVSDADLSRLDLQCWNVAFNGAEPISWQTLQRFAEKFRSAGFRAEAFYPCYGLAESTLLASGAVRGRGPRARWVDRAALASSRIEFAEAGAVDARCLVSSGRPHADMRLEIVDPETRRVCRPGEPGEIWLQGPSVSPGYHRDPEQTAQAFVALPSTGPDEAPFVRTGDLGFVDDGELYVFGRSKDLVIIRGQNYHPVDIERTVSASHELLHQHISAVFAAPDEAGNDSLCVLQEVPQSVRSKADLLAPELFQRIRESITAEHDIVPALIALVQPGALARTVSGKLQRYLCRDALLRGELQTVATWRAPKTLLDQVSNSGAATRQSREDIEAWLVREIAERISLDPATIDVHAPFSAFGLDSASAVMMTGELSAWMNRKLSPALAWDHPTIHQLARHLAEAD
jgi:acyl-CoA synthetase (AMP-forming)/AMP-acid ligase II/acyl carrier protein